jgi:pimeloyl-ACP methyl ester carboxylesterase
MFKHAYAELNGVRLHYVTAGEGKLILFVHGFPEFWYAWRNQLAEFARDYLAVAGRCAHRRFELLSRGPSRTTLS